MKCEHRNKCELYSEDSFTCNYESHNKSYCGKYRQLILTSILLLAVLCILPVVSSTVENLGTFTQNSCIKLKQTCSNCTFSNITSIMNPDSTIALNQSVMTKIGTEYNYSCGPSTQLGTYIVNGKSDINGIITVWAYNYNVTTTGKESGNTLPLFLLLGGFLIFIAAAYFKNEYIGLLSGMLFIVSGIYMMIYGLGMFADMYTRTIAFISLGIGLMVSFISMIEMFYTDLGIVGGGRDEED